MEELKNDFQGFYRIVIMDVNGFYMDFHGLSDDYITLEWLRKVPYIMGPNCIAFKIKS
jgi:hypothetical protein